MEVDIYDVRGRRILRLLDATLDSAGRQIQWHGRDAAGRAVASGRYLVRLRRGEEQVSGVLYVK